MSSSVLFNHVKRANARVNVARADRNSMRWNFLELGA